MAHKPEKTVKIPKDNSKTFLRPTVSDKSPYARPDRQKDTRLIVNAPPSSDAEKYWVSRGIVGK